jgi:hypothetical protein
VKRKSLLPVTVASCSGGKPGSVVWPEIEEQPTHSTICDNIVCNFFLLKIFFHREFFFSDVYKF